MPSNAKERKSMTGYSSLKDSEITPISVVPPDLEMCEMCMCVAITGIEAAPSN